MKNGWELLPRALQLVLNVVVVLMSALPISRWYNIYEWANNLSPPKVPVDIILYSMHRRKSQIEKLAQQLIVLARKEFF